MGDAITSPGRLSSVQVADEEGSSAKDQPPSERDAYGRRSRFWHSDDSMKSFWHSFGTVEARFGLLEQHLRFEVPYNHYALHVGA
jgi:hypothetical protein